MVLRDKSRLKKGRIEIIGDDKITILNRDGLCRDTLAVTPGEALSIRENIGFEAEVLYFVDGDKLVRIELEKSAPDLQKLYGMLPKEIECVPAF
jgi:hypothetical protein